MSSFMLYNLTISDVIPVAISENATRSCEENSTWAERSDYSRCKPLEEEEPHMKLLWDIKEAGTIYYVGYGMSLLALTAALSIFLHFK
ncbi:diuretic hormone receptor [Trichonephila clavata]|uniref:Diuretic hormone receptor n=1 Tax=Trichonephila clavata TaxID=2740835 RepID=A0A8X6LIG8_TRICU|nr:diuretic hormone receptor [Trichonephila clavata]